MEVREWYAKELQGLSLRNVSAAVYDGKKKLYEDFGEMLFTHYGVSGPLMLSASSVIGKRLSEKELRLVIDLKPALTAEQLDEWAEPIAAEYYDFGYDDILMGDAEESQLR